MTLVNKKIKRKLTKTTKTTQKQPKEGGSFETKQIDISVTHKHSYGKSKLSHVLNAFQIPKCGPIQISLKRQQMLGKDLPFG